MFVARVVVLARAAPDQYAKFGLVFEPFVPAVLVKVLKLVRCCPPDWVNVKPVKPCVVAVRLMVALDKFADTAVLGVAPLPHSQVLVVGPVPVFVIALYRFVATVVE